MEWIIAFGGWIVAVLSVWIGYRERTAARDEERLQQTLQYFTGGTQKRSVGIAMVEGVWKDKKRYRSILVPVLSNTVVYLLLTSDSREEAHEERNLVRLIRLLKEMLPRDSSLDHYRNDVLDAIEKKLEGHTQGLKMSDPTLTLWREMLGARGAV